jgi:SAM-dependent methyltransferases related to tRNA (uracil-5-)-methyltransferase
LNINSQQSKSILGDQEKILYGREFYYEELAGKKIKLNYKSFFQINNAICEKLFAFVKEQTKKSRTILDAYCGSGAISIYLAKEGKKIIGIDSDSAAIRNANENALENDLPGCQFLTGFVENEISRMSSQHGFDTIIFDPPRSGLAQNIITQLPSDLKKIVYISCDPQTQKRDIQQLIKVGFHPTLRKAFDMFPHTFHIENVIVLEK